MLTSVIKAVKDVILSACYVVPVLFRGRDRGCSAAAAKCALCVDPKKPFKMIVMPIVAASPLALRFVQCVSRYYASRSRWPHLYNATKRGLRRVASARGHVATPAGQVHGVAPHGRDRHVTTRRLASLMMVRGEGPGRRFHTDALPTFGRDSTAKDVTSGLYLFIFLSSTFYSFWWDLSQDWGLGVLRRNPVSPGYTVLRERLATRGSGVPLARPRMMPTRQVPLGLLRRRGLRLLRPLRLDADAHLRAELALVRFPESFSPSLGSMSFRLIL